MARRGIWKGHISFGLINIPVSVLSASDEKDVHFSLLDRRDHAPVGYVHVNKGTGDEIGWKDIVKGYQYAPEKYVIMDQKDFKRANVKATQTIDIEDFIDIDEIDPMLFDKPYYLMPMKGGEKGYVLLKETLARTKKVAVARFVLRTKQHLAAMMARGDYLVLEVLRFPHEVIDTSKKDLIGDISKPKITKQEMTMAQQLVEGMTTKWNPKKYKDTYYDDLMKLIHYKIKHGDTKTYHLEGDEEEGEETSANVVDLMPLLKQSLKKQGHSKKRKARSQWH